MDIAVSVVSGTYNRLPHLKNMVDSVRSSTGVGLPYEIVIVDGGSKDGTIDWCKNQPDIVLIEQGRLLGAVKAFNAGASRANGKYVIMANDDIQFLNESILCALSFMEDNSHIGIGCFYQNRGGRDWHVDQMPAILDGRQVSVYYGQVCIIPRWLGDRVGWWGNYLRTYGGDNEMSCNVWELGYKVEPAPCTAIIDTTPMDDLRRVNNQVQKIGGQHPDTYMWLKKWKKSSKLMGPTVRTNPVVPNPLKRATRILYAPIYEPGHPIQKLTKTGLRDALAEIGWVVEVDYIGMGVDYLMDVACAHDPDLFVMQVHDTTVIDKKVMKELRNVHPKAKFVNWNGDYHPDALISPEYISLAETFDLIGLVTTVVDDLYKKNNAHPFYWQIGYEEPRIVGQPVRVTHPHDVVFLANGYSDKRLKLARVLRRYNWDVGIYGSWPEDIRANGSNLYDFHSGHLLYQQAMLAISDSQWPGATGFVSNRLFQAMAAGVCLMQQRFGGMEKLLGLKDGKHLVVWDELGDLMDKIAYYLENKDKARAIGDRGKKYVIEHHSFRSRVSQMLVELAKYA